MKIKLTSEINVELWNDLLDNSHQATIFHTLEWLQTCTQLPNTKLCFLLIGDKQLRAALPFIQTKNFIFNNYYSLSLGYGSILYRSDEKNKEIIINSLLEYYLSLFNISTTRMVLIDYHNLISEKIILENNFNNIKREAHILPLDLDFEQIWKKSYKRSVRKLVKQAKRNGILWEYTDTTEGINAYYNVVEHTIKRHQGLVLPKTFYDYILRELVPKKLAAFHLARYNGEVIGGTLHLFYKGQIFNWLTASYKEHWHLRPNNLLISEMIRYGCENGYKSYNLGATPLEAKELVRFKKSWGAKSKIYNVYEKCSWLYNLIKR